MCDFCKEIHDFEEELDEDKDYISYDKDEECYWLHARIGLNHQQGLLYDVRYCPYCGKEIGK